MLFRSIDYMSGSAVVILTADNGTQLFSTTVTSFPVPINLSGIRDSQGGVVTISYETSVQEEIVDENGNITTQIKQIPQTETIPVVFTVE